MTLTGGQWSQHEAGGQHGYGHFDGLIRRGPHLGGKGGAQQGGLHRGQPKAVLLILLLLSQSAFSVDRQSCGWPTIIGATGELQFDFPGKTQSPARFGCVMCHKKHARCSFSDKGGLQVSGLGSIAAPMFGMKVICLFLFVSPSCAFSSSMARTHAKILFQMGVESGNY